MASKRWSQNLSQAAQSPRWHSGPQCPVLGVTVPNLQVKTLGLKDERPPQGHTAGRWLGRTYARVHVAPKPGLLPSKWTAGKAGPPGGVGPQVAVKTAGPHAPLPGLSRVPRFPLAGRAPSSPSFLGPLSLRSVSCC